jgi:predicted metal-dependent hydrolase
MGTDRTLMRQLVLDLFGWAGAPPPVVAPVAPIAPTIAPATSAALTPPLAPPSASSPTPDRTAAPDYDHPRANRRVRLAGVLVAYELRRGRRRTIGFAIGPDGLTVSAPRWTTLAEVDAALHEKARWITTRLLQARERAAQLATARIDWCAGASVPYLGEPLLLAADPRLSRSGAALDPPDSAANPATGQPRILRLPLAPDATPRQWRDATGTWLTRQARRLFTAQLDHYAPQLGVHWQRLSLSSAQTRWGSASAEGSIRLNWRLIHFSLPVIDYVVVHELAHLREMNHSPRFWAHVEHVLPDYDTCRTALREAVLPAWS